MAKKTSFYSARSDKCAITNNVSCILYNRLQGPCLPALMSIMAKWVPPQERSLHGAIIFGGSQLGNVFGSFISGLLLSGGRDWAYVFYLFGVLGILWFIFWVSSD